MALDIHIKTIPHWKQIYNTVGNYFGKKKKHVLVSDLKNETYELAVALHELIEQHLTELDGIPLKAIDDFDIQFEKEYKEGLHKAEDEPGDDPRAPYYAAHQFATAIERLFVQQSGFTWRDYEDFVTKVWRQK